MSDLLILALILLVIAFTFGVDFIYYVFYVILGVYLTGRFLLPGVIRKLSLDRTYNQNAFLGEQVDVRLTISNKSWIPIPWLRAVESIPPVLRIGKGVDQAMTFRYRESKTLTYKVKAMKRGYYRLGPLIISAGDLFGIREINGQLAPAYLTVFPRIVRLSQLGLSSRLPYGTIPTNHRTFEDPARPIGIREYRSGDSMRHINWKVSAHSDDLLVRTFEQVKSLETMVLLNLNPKEYSRQTRYDSPEWAIVVAASIAGHLAELRQASGLATNGIDPLSLLEGDGSDSFDPKTGRLEFAKRILQRGSDDQKRSFNAQTELVTIPPRPGRAHLMKILEKLARIEAQDSVPFPYWVPRACTQLSWGVTVIAITPTSDDRTCAALHSLVKSGYNPVLIVIEPYKDIREIREKARSLGFQAYKVSEDRDLAKWRSPKTSVGVSG